MMFFISPSMIGVEDISQPPVLTGARQPFIKEEMVPFIQGGKGPYCFGIDKTICDTFKPVKIMNKEFDFRPSCIVISNLLCVVVIVSILTIVLGIAVAGLIL